jgi:hypothetical protein
MFMGDGARRLFSFLSQKIIATATLSLLSPSSSSNVGSNKPPKPHISLMVSLLVIGISIILAAWHCSVNYEISNQKKDEHGWTMHR